MFVLAGPVFHKIVFAKKFALMFLIFILGMLAKNVKDDADEAQFMDRLSLMHPHVSVNGRNPFYLLDGDFVSFAGTRSDHTQICYSSPNSTGIVQMREPIKTRAFKFEITFELNPVSGGSGFGFWLSERLVKGNFYGRSPDFKGVGVVIDTKGRPFVQFTAPSSGAAEKAFYPNFSNNRILLTMENHGKRLNIKFKAGKDEFVLFNGVANVDPGYVFGISGSTGGASSALIFHSVAGYSITTIKGAYIKGETKKSSKLITLFGLFCIVGLIYYLYRKQNKDMSLKN